MFGQFSLAYLDAKYDEFIGSSGQDFSGNELEQTPAITFSGLVRYGWDVSSGMMFVQSDVSFKDDHFLDNANGSLSFVESYWLWGGRVGYTVGKMTFSVWGKNLADEEYRTNWFDVASLGFNAQQFGESRTYGASNNFEL